MRKMFWKLIILLMGRRASSFNRAVKARNKIYTVQIKEYEPSDKLIQKMGEALDGAKSKA